MTTPLAPELAADGRTTHISPEQSQNRQSLGGLASMFRALNMTQKGQWQIAANQLNSISNRTGRKKLTAGTAFSLINSARIAAQMDISLVPILPMVGPPAFPLFMLTARQVGGQFSLTLSASRDVPNQLVIAAAPFAYAGRTTYAKSSFKPIGVIGGFSSPANITSLLTAKYGVPQEGSAIALRMYGVSDCGLRSSDLVITTVFLAVSENAPTGDTETTLKVA